MTDQNNKSELRRTFIAMLFALVVATIANRYAELAFLATDGWSSPLFSFTFFNNLFKDEWLLLAPFAHATLGVLLVSMSWVGWSRSLASGHQVPIKRLRSIPFLILLIEVMLVTVYFGIAISIELKTDIDMLAQYVSSNYVVQVSAVPETMLLMSVYIIYLLWDFLADVCSSPLWREQCKCHQKPWHNRVHWLSGLAVYGFSSGLGILLCWFIYLVIPEVSDAKETVYADLALMSVLAVFYSSKSFESKLIKLFPWEGSRKNSQRPMTLTAKKNLILSFTAYIFFLVLLWD